MRFRSLFVSLKSFMVFNEEFSSTFFHFLKIWPVCRSGIDLMLSFKVAAALKPSMC